jgi:predicted DNA binding CopG/RHH family protein
VPDTGGKEEKCMKKQIEYTDAPNEIDEALDNAVLIPNFKLTPETVKELEIKRTKKPLSIYLSIETIEKFKAAAKKDGKRYQTMISNVLDTYTQQYL